MKLTVSAMLITENISSFSPYIFISSDHRIMRICLQNLIDVGNQRTFNVGF